MEKTALRNNKPILSLILYEADKSKTILSNSSFHDSYSFVYFWLSYKGTNEELQLRKSC